MVYILRWWCEIEYYGIWNSCISLLTLEQLEQEVFSLKRRLDELRKAKNTTVIKRERETVEVNAPKVGSRRYQ